MQKDIQTGSKVANALIATKESGSPINKPNPNSWRKALKVEALTSHIPRRRLTVEQEQILLKRFAVQEYLSKREMEELAEELKIPTSQLRTWFGNRRSKLKAAARQKAKMKAGMGHL
ncbi:hypothetical protein BY996DRAFT_4595378 [Phakopsora pachyrhizi]|uniref:Expressed protein n=1 Tax=Phakopsora pachyrhizi TaxID=170000 RepID=A0AAV0AH89_PHAPC|nr:hypothetical protein BY996DRAFT_4595378 [Phakopsora pachyrhizi]CAH7667133.1 expressed protein [Phakopsora pachyrhizi]